MSGLREVLYEAQLSQQTPRDSTFTDEFLNSAGYALVQMPAEGLSQLSNRLIGTEFAPNFMNAPAPAQFGSRQWYGQQTGSAVGALPWLVGLHYIARGGSRSLIARETANTISLRGGLAMTRDSLAVWESGAVGLTYGAVLTPVDPNRTDFWRARATNGAVSAITFATMSGTSQIARNRLFGTGANAMMQAETQTGAQSALRTFITDRARLSATGAFGGLMAGPVDATLHSIADHRRLPTWENVAESTYGFTLIGGGMGAFGPRPRSTVFDIMERTATRSDTRLRNLSSTESTGRTGTSPLSARGDTAIIVIDPLPASERAALTDPLSRTQAAAESVNSTDTTGRGRDTSIPTRGNSAVIVIDPLPASERAALSDPLSRAQAAAETVSNADTTGRGRNTSLAARGDTGVIVIDPLPASERAALSDPLSRTQGAAETNTTRTEAPTSGDRATAGQPRVITIDPNPTPTTVESTTSGTNPTTTGDRTTAGQPRVITIDPNPTPTAVESTTSGTNPTTTGDRTTAGPRTITIDPNPTPTAVESTTSGTNPTTTGDRTTPLGQRAAEAARQDSAPPVTESRPTGQGPESSVERGRNTEPPVEQSPDTILRGAQALVEDLNTQFPQVGPDGRLNYYLAGSLGTMMILAGDGYRVIDPRALPEIRPGETRQLPPEAREGLRRFIRQVGDLDFVQMPESQNSANRMRKGGGSVTVDSLSPRALDALKRPTPGGSVMCDPLSPADGHRVIEVDMGGRKVYVASPETGLAYKIVHFAESFGRNEGKNGQMINDIDSLLRAQEAMRPGAEIEADVYRTLFAYNARSMNGLYMPYYMPQFEGRIRGFMERVVSRHPDFHYLPEFNFGRERSISFLKLLNVFETPEAKRLAIDIVNENRAAVDRWGTADTERNRTMAAEHLLRNPELFREINQHLQLGETPTLQEVRDKLRTNPWAVDRVAQLRPDLAFDRRPVSSDLMTLLGRVRPSTAMAELPVLRELMRKGVDPFTVDRVLDCQTFADPEIRSMLFDRMNQAAQQPGTEAINRFLTQVKDAVDPYKYDARSGRFISRTPDQIRTDVRLFLGG